MTTPRVIDSAARSMFLEGLSPRLTTPDQAAVWFSLLIRDPTR